ncbi:MULTISPECIES: hypothetical protein [Gammaproteobacteria]|uniref:hypothetical protein n=1 Tax=Gammaproteobacteria TaxID=1236 RepID=UPI001AD9BBF1|nr:MULTISPECIES: hypothetical protein [Gammaproteobacteria]MBO9484503.1 hypothetical protein [Salinisphaera sp. G21_0]MBO9497118.1 hypothetical protein [Thalassotalea sp. G20_0]
MFGFLNKFKMIGVQGGADSLLRRAGLPNNLASFVVYGNPFSKTIFSAVLDQCNQLSKLEKAFVSSIILMEFMTSSSRDNEKAYNLYSERVFIMISSLSDLISKGEISFGPFSVAYCKTYEDVFSSPLSKAEFEKKLNFTDSFNRQVDFVENIADRAESKKKSLYY